MKFSYLTKLLLLSIALICFVCSGCEKKGPQFTIKGKVSDADSMTIYLERRTLNSTTVIDSAKLNSDGEFVFEQPVFEYAEFYLLKLGNQNINLAIDSTETITIEAKKGSFATDYVIEGSDNSAKMKDIALAQYRLSDSILVYKKEYADKKITQDVYSTKMTSEIDIYKERLKNIIGNDLHGMAAYFGVFQKVDGLLILDPMVKKERQFYQAVATGWDQKRPSSPRTEQIRNFVLSAMAEEKRIADGEKIMGSIEPKEISSSAYFDFSLPSIKGDKVSVSDLKGKALIVDFTAYGSGTSSAHNILLNSVYSKHKQALQIYQVSLDPDIHIWQNTAVNLPWICVWDSKSGESELIMRFGIQQLPAIFLFDKQGNIVKRLDANENLETEVQKIRKFH